MADTSTDSREDGGLGSATARAPQHENDDSRITVEDAIQRINSRDPALESLVFTDIAPPILSEREERTRLSMQRLTDALVRNGDACSNIRKVHIPHSMYTYMIWNMWDFYRQGKSLIQLLTNLPSVVDLSFGKEDPTSGHFYARNYLSIALPMVLSSSHISETKQKQLQRLYVERPAMHTGSVGIEEAKSLNHLNDIRELQLVNIEVANSLCLGYFDNFFSSLKLSETLETLTISAKQCFELQPTLLQADAISSFCRSASNLKDLCLQGFSFRDDEIHGITSSLADNKVLERLVIEESSNPGNRITESSYFALLHLIEKNYTIREMRLSIGKSTRQSKSRCTESSIQNREWFSDCYDTYCLLNSANRRNIVHNNEANTSEFVKLLFLARNNLYVLWRLILSRPNVCSREVEKARTNKRSRAEALVANPKRQRVTATKGMSND